MNGSRTRRLFGPLRLYWIDERFSFSKGVTRAINQSCISAVQGSPVRYGTS